LSITFVARADLRVLAGGLVLGLAVGAALGGASLAGHAAGRADAKAEAQRFAGSAAQGFSNSALQAQAAWMTPGELALAQRHDPLAGTSDTQRDRLAAAFANQLLQRADVPAAAPAGSQAAADTGLNTVHAATLLRASFTAPANPQARPFHMDGALDSARDLDCLADAVYYEARGETPAGQAAVAQVVLNRVRHPAFPKSVCAVVFQGAHDGSGCQFSFACDGSMNRGREPTAWRRAREVAAHALAGFVMPSVGNATHFHVAGIDPGWGPRLLRVAQIGLHVFYRFGGYAGSPDNFNRHPQLSPSGSEAPHPMLASILPLPTETADGRVHGEYILASATVISNAPAKAAPTEAKPEAAKPDAAAPVQTAHTDAKAEAPKVAAPAPVQTVKAA
jgi:spore germination cell wall hydrolase CwlJ-like protein